MTRTKMMQRFAGVAALAVAASAFGQIDRYEQDFEGLDMMDPNALANDGWLVGANVFENGSFIYNYFAFPAPNPGIGFSAIATGQGGPDQGMQQLSVYNDYNNGDHNNPNIRIEANVFNEWTVGAQDVGTWTFTFDAKAGNIDDSVNDTTAAAFIKVLDPTAGFSQTGGDLVDMTNTPDTWQGYTLTTTIDASQVGQIFQIGFWSVAGNFEDSGIFYDNLRLVPTPGSVAVLGLAGLAATRRRRG